MFKKHPENKIKHSILKIVYIYREVRMQNSMWTSTITTTV